MGLIGSKPQPLARLQGHPILAPQHLHRSFQDKNLFGHATVMRLGEMALAGVQRHMKGFCRQRGIKGKHHLDRDRTGKLDRAKDPFPTSREIRLRCFANQRAQREMKPFCDLPQSGNGGT